MLFALLALGNITPLYTSEQLSTQIPKQLSEKKEANISKKSGSAALQQMTSEEQVNKKQRCRGVQDSLEPLTICTHQRRLTRGSCLSAFLATACARASLAFAGLPREAAN